LALKKLGGTGRRRTVLPVVFDRMKSEFTQVDLEPLTAGELRWKRTASWSAEALIEKGEMTRPSFGLWKITEKGMSRIQGRQG
jgi:hypothetical protein